MFVGVRGSTRKTIKMNVYNRFYILENIMIFSCYAIKVKCPAILQIRNRKLLRPVVQEFRNHSAEERAVDLIFKNLKLESSCLHNQPMFDGQSSGRKKTPTRASAMETGKCLSVTHSPSRNAFTKSSNTNKKSISQSFKYI